MNFSQQIKQSNTDEWYTMSGIYIPGMEMPKGRPVCVVIDAAGQARRYDLNNDRYADDELFEAVPVPDHVERSCRLIDIDLLKTLLCVKDEDYDNPCISPHYLEQQLDMLLLDDAPTIIPAEEGAE